MVGAGRGFGPAVASNLLLTLLGLQPC